MSSIIFVLLYIQLWYLKSSCHLYEPPHALYGPFKRGEPLHPDMDDSLKFIQHDSVLLGGNTVQVEVFEISPADLERFKEARETKDYKVKKKVLASSLNAYILTYMPLEDERRQ
jgi:hypothetical protein